ncbi:MAG: hypothetical protein O7H39_17835, partial [Gammaproteobacteria bacterium]|nr:hypothetical protein [Gammaproteobacteria bacterium]
LAANLCLSMTLVGCTSMKTYDLPPAELHQQIRAGELVSTGDHVVIVTSDGLRRIVVSAVDEDSIFGESSAPIPIDEINAIEVRKFRAGKTILLVAGTAAATFGFLISLALSSL